MSIDRVDPTLARRRTLRCRRRSNLYLGRTTRLGQTSGEGYIYLTRQPQLLEHNHPSPGVSRSPTVSTTLCQNEASFTEFFDQFFPFESSLSHFQYSASPATTSISVTDTSSTVTDFFKITDEEIAASLIEQLIMPLVSRLHPELLARIFFFSATVEEPTPWTPVLGWIRVTHVCSHWRWAALDHSALWANSHEMIRRAKLVPLLIRPYEILTGADSKIAMDILHSHLAHTAETLAASAPFLEVVAICSLDRHVYLPVDLFTHHAPRLRSALLKGCSVPWSSPLLRNLSCLEIANLLPWLYNADATPHLPSHEEFFDLLANMRQLESLSIDQIFPRYLPGATVSSRMRHPVIKLPHLLYLKLVGQWSNCAPVLGSIEVPATSTIHLSCWNFDHDSFSSVLPPIFQRHSGKTGEASSMRILCIHVNDEITTDILIWGSNLGGPETLNTILRALHIQELSILSFGLRSWDFERWLVTFKLLESAQRLESVACENDACSLFSSTLAHTSVSESEPVSAYDQVVTFPQLRFVKLWGDFLEVGPVPPTRHQGLSIGRVVSADQLVETLERREALGVPLERLEIHIHAYRADPEDLDQLSAAAPVDVIEVLDDSCPDHHRLMGVPVTGKIMGCKDVVLERDVWQRVLSDIPRNQTRHVLIETSMVKIISTLSALVLNISKLQHRRAVSDSRQRLGISHLEEANVFVSRIYSLLSGPVSRDTELQPLPQGEAALHQLCASKKRPCPSGSLKDGRACMSPVHVTVQEGNAAMSTTAAPPNQEQRWLDLHGDRDPAALDPSRRWSSPVVPDREPRRAGHKASSASSPRPWTCWRVGPLAQAAARLDTAIQHVKRVTGHKIDTSKPASPEMNGHKQCIALCIKMIDERGSNWHWMDEAIGNGYTFVSNLGMDKGNTGLQSLEEGCLGPFGTLGKSPLIIKLYDIRTRAVSKMAVHILRSHLCHVAELRLFSNKALLDPIMEALTTLTLSLEEAEIWSIACFRGSIILSPSPGLRNLSHLDIALRPSSLYSYVDMTPYLPSHGGFFDLLANMCRLESLSINEYFPQHLPGATAASQMRHSVIKLPRLSNLELVGQWSDFAPFLELIEVPATSTIISTMCFSRSLRDSGKTGDALPMRTLLIGANNDDSDDASLDIWGWTTSDAETLKAILQALHIQELSKLCVESRTRLAEDHCTLTELVESAQHLEHIACEDDACSILSSMLAHPSMRESGPVNAHDQAFSRVRFVELWIDSLGDDAVLRHKEPVAGRPMVSVDMLVEFIERREALGVPLERLAVHMSSDIDPKYLDQIRAAAQNTVIEVLDQ
ncbi:hypothetical protein HETIRDRAFT_425938 [Heterobasidion irregulare TC 32-1]|uniref:F-box domain-containing protein n=1 Tax=Heterobasidion irregulare (strain TC 32-1) TaxID=747525 RepID=W4KFQ8_HETIT|nr:uncharacterized protein HETIRDRAFT_425938 [Heterobasidion irregulare TC 32-1]ETW84687.1 hypothetical protein HETIRDRAFT_425938 [Heterobasidion irregulare TC 32-1]